MVIIQATRDTYSAEESAKQSVKVKELIDMLSQYDGDEKVVLSHDGGYTYGYINEYKIDTD